MQITVRGLEPDVEQAIRKLALRKNQSINQVIKEILHREFKGDQSPASSLRRLAGGWSQEQAGEFEQAIDLCERIDDEMWK